MMLPSPVRFYDAPVMRGDGGIEQIAPQPAQPSQCPILVGASKPAVSDHIRRQNRREFAMLAAIISALRLLRRSSLVPGSEPGCRT
jgi:hypothetical protein